METTDARILVVDDDAGIHEYLAIQLTTEGYTVSKTGHPAGDKQRPQ